MSPSRLPWKKSTDKELKKKPCLPQFHSEPTLSSYRSLSRRHWRGAEASRLRFSEWGTSYSNWSWRSSLIFSLFNMWMFRGWAWLSVFHSVLRNPLLQNLCSVFVFEIWDLRAFVPRILGIPNVDAFACARVWMLNWKFMKFVTVL